MTTDSEKNQKLSASAPKLGTFAGVFTPSILTILGIILFLRLGYVVGAAGFGRILIIISLANLISILTSASLSTVATNIRVKGGGDYYLISRTLGVQFGGSIGLVLFLAQSVSIAFYCIGFGEAIAAIIPPGPFVTPQTVAAMAVALLSILAWMGADWATKFQYVVMGLLAFALISFFAGGFLSFTFHQLIRNWPVPVNGLSFWVLFSIFFPAVTGFTQGVSMSGDLKNPGKSLPLGTFLAVGFSLLIYFGAAMVFAGVLSNEELMADYNGMKKVALFPMLIDAGVIAATLSSAMASFLGAPRILQSLAKDQIFTILNPLAKGSGPEDNPRRGVLLSGTIALVTISLGQLNLIAQIVSMFFLISYGLLNYATFFEARSARPSFRPRFRWFSPWLSLAGFIVCLGAMVAIDVKTGLMAIFFLTAIYQYLKRSPGRTRWADSKRSYYLQRVRENLRAAAAEPEHEGDWRPVVIALTHTVERRERLLTFAQWIEGGAGFTVAVQLLEGRGIQMKSARQEAQADLSQRIKAMDMDVYPLAIAVEEVPQALPIMIQSFGLGPLKANTLLINWMDQLIKGISGIGALQYAQNLRIAHRHGLNLIILKSDLESLSHISSTLDHERIIDVWWHNDATSRLMLLLAYLATRSKTWEEAQIRVITAGTGQNVSKVNYELKNLLEEFRIDAKPLIVPNYEQETILATSSAAALVFMPFRIREYKILDASGNSLTRLLAKLPLTALVMAAEEIDLTAEPDSGLVGELAAAADALSDAEKRVEQAEKEAQKLRKAADKMTKQLSILPKDDKRLTKLIKETDEALQETEHAFRKVAKARAKADEAAKQLSEVTQEAGFLPESKDNDDSKK